MVVSHVEPMAACVAGLEIFLFGMETRSCAPVVFVTHGRGGTVEHVFPMCRQLAQSGMVAVAVEQRNHGKRLVDPHANEGWSPHHAADMYSSMVGTALDISLLIDMIPACLGLTMERIGMTGVSMGGHATLLAMALDPRIVVGAPLIGSGDYGRLMRLRAMTNQTPPSEFAQYFPPALQSAVMKYDPINHAERFADRPLLLINGAVDQLVPAECNQCFADQIRPCYTHPDRLVLDIFPGIGHDVTPAMWEEAQDWLQRWLVEEEYAVVPGA